MLRAAALGIVTVQREGAAAEAVRAADILVHDVRDALDLLLEPRRLGATLRS
jgi:soluble P-type ATPase